MKFFTVYDSKASVYLTPFAAPTTGDAIRSFSTAANDPKTNINQYAEDYTLFETAKFQELSGTFEVLKTPHSIAKAIELKKSH